MAFNLDDLLPDSKHALAYKKPLPPLDHLHLLSELPRHQAACVQARQPAGTDGLWRRP
jgi:hypothetical protein